MQEKLGKNIPLIFNSGLKALIEMYCIANLQDLLSPIWQGLEHHIHHWMISHLPTNLDKITVFQGVVLEFAPLCNDRQALCKGQISLCACMAPYTQLSSFNLLFITQGGFKNYVDKKRWVGSPKKVENVNVGG